ncbi:MAG: hypothetical protein JO250_22645 [Armatimonadetes bacterium]|nr:hypothetical protein [Armatimonadota bacterium]
MGAILILGRNEDLCGQIVAEALRRDGRKVLFLPEDQLLPEMSLAWTPADGGGGVRFRGQEARFAELDGVLYRFYGMPLPAEEFQTQDGRYICAEWNALFMAWLRPLPCPVINRLQPDLWYKTRLNVPALSALMPDLPFARPRILVTTRAEEARAFRRRLAGPVTYAALSGSAPYPIRDEDDLEKLTALSGALPLHLTEALDGRAMEAFVVGNTVTLVGADGTAAGSAPASLVDRCLQVGTHLGLTFFQLSLVERAGGDWYCLALDRMPQLYACGPAAREEIVGHLVALLTGKGGQAA